MKALIDYIPLIIFFILYKTTEPTNTHHPLLQLFGAQGVDNNHLLVGTAGMLIATIVVYGTLFFVQKFRLDKAQLFALIMMIVFGGITLALSDDYYIRLKAVLLNLGFAVGFLVAPYFFKNKEPIVKKMFEPIFHLSQAGWQKLNLAFVGLFFLLSVLHGFFAFVFMNGRYWGEFTAFGDIIVMLVFLAGLMFVLRKHIKLDDKPTLSQ